MDELEDYLLENISHPSNTKRLESKRDAAAREL
jgi:hypothetical protein